MHWRYFARRLAMLLASLLIASFVIFAALYLAPGNPVAALSGGRSLPASSIAVLEQRYHLNQPFLAQYWYWLDNALHGNLGISITLRENVSTLLASRVWTTAGLVLYASLIIAVLGIGIGIVMAAPIGPVNVLVIQRAVAGGFWAGFAAGLGADGKAADFPRALQKGLPDAMDLLVIAVDADRSRAVLAEQAVRGLEHALATALA